MLSALRKKHSNVHSCVCLHLRSFAPSSLFTLRCNITSCPQPGVRESIAMTYKLEEIWKRSTAAARNRSVDVDQLDNYALYRYVGTREGVYRVYPAVRVPTKFDPIKQPWSVPVIFAPFFRG